LAKRAEDDPSAMMFSLENPKFSLFTVNAVSDNDLFRHNMNEQVKQLLLENEQHRFKM
jgi:hypothetical protein